MSKTYNWSNFYDKLCRLGPHILVGIDEDLREMIAVSGSSTDMFWSEGLQILLEEGAANDELRGGVLSALDQWRENVLTTLDTDFSIELDWKSVSLDRNSALIDELVQAASN